MLIITIINRTNGGLADQDVQGVIRAINRQIREDFEPYWSFGAQLRLEGRAGIGRGNLIRRMLAEKRLAKLKAARVTVRR